MSYFLPLFYLTIYFKAFFNEKIYHRIIWKNFKDLSLIHIIMKFKNRIRRKEKFSKKKKRKKVNIVFDEKERK